MRKRRVYDHPGPGEWMLPKQKGYRLGCCDCGLVHKIDFRVVDGKAELRFFRDNRATAGIRRRAHPFAKVKAGA